jgi:formamidopyrimidine-DNA glycosylase
LPAGKHDHVDIKLDSGQIIRFNDPRRFGCLLWQPKGETHRLLKNLGVEPLSYDFSEKYLFEHSRHRKTSIKSFLMNQSVVVGIGNIYAAEILFKVGILPSKKVSQITYHDCIAIVKTARDILTSATTDGGTTFRDYTHSDGQPGRFKEKLLVYGRSGKLCLVCSNTLKSGRISNRSTVWCDVCQK